MAMMARYSVCIRYSAPKRSVDILQERRLHSPSGLPGTFAFHVDFCIVGNLASEEFCPIPKFITITTHFSIWHFRHDPLNLYIEFRRK